MSNALGGGNGWLGIVEEVASVALAAETGGASLAVTSTFSQVAEQAFTQAASQMVSQELVNVGSQAFTSAFTQVAEQALGQAFTSVAQDVVDGIVDAANNQGPNGTYTGDLDRAQNDMTQATQNLMQSIMDANAKKRGKDDAAGASGGNSWFVALAKALGEAEGKHLSNMLTLAGQMNQLSTSVDVSGSSSAGATNQQNSEKFATLNAEFQAEAQEFQMLSEATSTAIKSIGQGLSDIARKQ